MPPKLKREERLKARTALIFPWRPVPSPLMPKLVALGISVCFFGILLAGFQVHVVSPGIITGRHASLMMMPSGAEGAMWAAKAREGGPFPSRFEPGQWSGAAEIDEELQALLRQPAMPYETALRDLPVSEPIPPIPLAGKGKRILPPLPPAGEKTISSAAIRLAPFLYPLSGISFGDMPSSLPSYSGEITGPMAAVVWRFLIRLHADGSVAGCISLNGSGEPGMEELQAWLRGVKFQSATAEKSEWIAIAVGFGNLQTDGTDAR